MPGQTHETILLEVIDLLTKAGFHVIRLEKRIIPDAISIDFGNKRVTQIEVASNPIDLYLARMKADSGDYDEKVIVTRQPDNRRQNVHSAKEFLRVIKLREEGKSYREISEIASSEFKRKISIGTIYSWVHGERIPYSVLVSDN